MTEQPSKIFDLQIGPTGNPELVIVPQGSQCPSSIPMSWKQLKYLRERSLVIEEA